MVENSYTRTLQYLIILAILTKVSDSIVESLLLIVGACVMAWFFNSLFGED